MRIVFVRHTAVNVESGVCYGRYDVGVKDTFPEEADRVKTALSEITARSGKGFDAVYRSPLSRCALLAEACGYGEAIPDNRLLEMNFGEWEMKRYEEIRDPRLQEWYDDWVNVAPTGGESFLDQYRRVEAFIAEIKESGKENVLVFAHAGVMMNAMLVAGMASVENIFDRQPPYGGLLEIEF